MEFKKGEIYLIKTRDMEGDDSENIRPVVIVQNNIANKYAPTLIVAPITSAIRKVKLPTQIEIDLTIDDLKQKSIILLESIMTISKERLVRKVGILSEDEIFRINKGLEVSFDIRANRSIEEEKRKIEEEKKEMEEYIKNISRPLVVTEGKTDVKIIETAWNKLYPDKDMFFECIHSGIEFDKEKRNGGAENLRRSLEFSAITANRVIIGVFDNDRAGNNHFKGLSKEVFEKYSIENEVRKHKNTNVWGMLLPVPENRKLFVTDDDINQRYFVIEHYFSDEVLKNHKMYGKRILDSSVFQVNNGKNKFSDEIKKLDSKEFENFRILFDRLEELVKKAN